LNRGSYFILNLADIVCSVSPRCDRTAMSKCIFMSPWIAVSFWMTWES